MLKTAVVFLLQNKREFAFSVTTSNNTSRFSHTSDIILKKMEEKKKTQKKGEVSDKCLRTHREIQHKLFTLLVVLLMSNSFSCLATI